MGDAEPLYREVLRLDSRHADSLHLLGVIALQTARHELAIDLIGRAIAVRAHVASFHSNLGNAYIGLGRRDEAVACWRRAIALAPDCAEAHFNLGNALREIGRLDEAVASYRCAIHLNPGDPEAQHNLGNVLSQQGLPDQAVACYRRAIQLSPAYAEAHNSLGFALQQQGQLDQAIASYHTALGLRPDHAGAHNNLGVALAEQWRLDEAVGCYDRALALNPRSVEARVNLGVARMRQGRLDEAVACHDRALALRPDDPDAHRALAVVFKQLGRLDEAVACCRKAVALRPNCAETHNNLAMLLLARGEMPQGWEEYEWRWQTSQLRLGHRAFAQPQWRGEPAGGRTLLVHAEQGFGDTLQFCRYATLVAQRGLRVVMEVPQPLARLIATVPGVAKVVARGEALPGFDLHCPMLSLPLAFGTTVATIPADESYLHADACQVAAWGARLAAAGKRGPRIGLVWSGNPRAHAPALTAVDRRRSLPPDLLAPLFGVSGVTFFSLQKDGPAAPKHFALTDFMNEMGDFADTAAVVANLDLVISVDTAVAHLAAALGKPVWLMDRFDPCWRWLTGRRDSPWYPTLRIYRQPKPGDWDAVIAEIARDLER